MCDILVRRFLRDIDPVNCERKSRGILRLLGSTSGVMSFRVYFPNPSTVGKNWHLVPLYVVIYSEDHRRFNQLKKSCRALQLSESMDDPSLMDLARAWLKDCLTRCPGHENCHRSGERPFRPARLLNISKSVSHLSIGMESTSKDKYCTLSYCWGDSNQVVLTAANEEAFFKSINYQELPKTIQDAITVARSLNFRFIWTDSLCIIQRGDKGKDWTLHSSEMSNIYSNSLLNISADRAASANDGFLIRRAGTLIRSFLQDRTPEMSGQQRQCIITFPNIGAAVLAKEPLGSRGWVLSERMLSPRILHFSGVEMYWECYSRKVESESCPKGTGSAMTSSEYPCGRQLYGRLEMDDWLHIVRNYTGMRLTMPALDKLVALAGLAQLYEERSGHTIVAGMLKDNLPRSLLWFRERFPGTLAKPSPDYRAPSWSWASMDGSISYVYIIGQPTTTVATILDVWTRPKPGFNRFGQIEDGALSVSGPTTRIIDLDKWFLDRTAVVLECVLDEPSNHNISDATEVLFLTADNSPDQSEGAKAMGLLLKCGVKKDTWTRVGVLIVHFVELTSPWKLVNALEKRTFTIV